jgi:hypothetical protein
MISNMRTDRRIAAIALPSAVALLLAGCSGDGFEGTARCNATVAEVVFDPNEQVEIRTGGDRVGWADAGGRGVDDKTCKRVETQTEWFVGIEYTRATEPTMLRCWFPERFFVNVHPTYSSESGEMFPDGSALSLVAEERRTIVASASITDASAGDSLQYSREHCTAL